ncbi:MAG: phosphate signaling complex protein PhoU [Lachnospiraceae bacterium]|nr:phosphate signaling complex protein PhoU [Lachnospiraceae bacterium]
MRNFFDKQLEVLHESLIEMGEKCEKAIRMAVGSLFDEHTDVKTNLEEINEIEKEINDMERDIESMCMKLLLKQQPVAGDLRMVSSALRMISDMERIGDQSLDIVEISEYVRGKEMSGKIQLSAMATAVTKMVNDSIAAFVNKDLELAKYVMEYDDIVDDFFVKIKKELIDILSKGDKDGEVFIDLLMIAKYLERIGDHATNIAESVDFYLTGTRDYV